MPRYVLVCGCARSGTSALTYYLNRHPDVALGMERYNRYTRTGGRLDTALFAPERFLDIRPGDTFYKDFSFFPDHEQIHDKYRKAAIVGDKVPKYYLKYDEAFQSIANVKFIYILRNIYDVAASYKVRAARGALWPKWRTVPSAIEDWNLSLRRTAEHVGSGRIHIVPYEEFFLKGEGADALWRFLDLDPGTLGQEAVPDGQPASSQGASPKVLDALDAYQIASEADFELYRALLSRASTAKKGPGASQDHSWWASLTKRGRSRDKRSSSASCHESAQHRRGRGAEAGRDDEKRADDVSGADHGGPLNALGTA